MNCPICNKTMVKIIYGEPDLKLFERAEQKKVFLGGCLVSDNDPKYHCYICERNFYEDLKPSIDRD